MATIILSDIAQNGVKGAKKIKSKTNGKYKEVMKEMNENIQRDHAHYNEIYKRASNFIVI